MKDAAARSSSGNGHPPTRFGVCTHPPSPLLRGSARSSVPPFGDAVYLTVAAAASPASGISPTWWQHRRFGVVHPPGKRPAARRVGTCWPWLPSARCFSVCGRQLPVPRPLARCKLARVARQSSSQCGGEQVQLLRRNSDSRCARHNYHLNSPRGGAGAAALAHPTPPLPSLPSVCLPACAADRHRHVCYHHCRLRCCRRPRHGRRHPRRRRCLRCFLRRPRHPPPPSPLPPAPLPPAPPLAQFLDCLSCSCVSGLELLPRLSQLHTDACMRMRAAISNLPHAA